MTPSGVEEQDLNVRAARGSNTTRRHTGRAPRIRSTSAARRRGELAAVSPSELQDTSVLRKRLGLAIDKVIHHDDVVLTVIVRTGRLVTTSDPHPRYPSVVKNDAEE